MVLEQGRHIVGIQRICLIINNKEKDFLWLISFLFPGSHPGEFQWESLCCCKYPDCCGRCDHGSRLPGVLWRCEGKPLHASVVFHRLASDPAPAGGGRRTRSDFQTSVCEHCE